jgi:hypothetical protein
MAARDLGSVVPAVWLCLLAGCTPFNYSSPKVARTQAVTVAAPPGEAYAFRVEVVQRQTARGAREDLSSDSSARATLRRVPLGPDGRVAAQRQFAVDSLCGWNCLGFRKGTCTEHQLALRLYRPGWRTVEVTADDPAGAVRWEEAPSPQAQEDAVDALLLGADQKAETPRDDLAAGAEPFAPAERAALVTRFYAMSFSAKLARGPAPAGHREALRFAADEYHRLGAAAADPAARERLLAKAAALRELSSAR